MISAAGRAWRAAILSVVLLAPLALPAASSPSAPAQERTIAGSGDALRARYGELRTRLEHNAFGQPLYLLSEEGSKSVQGDVYGIVDHPFRDVQTLADAANWCHVLILPFNTKNCTSGAGTLSLYVGRKSQEPIDRAFRLDFRFIPVAAEPGYLQRSLRAADGPVGTRNYAITLEAAPLDDTHSFIHLSYSYQYGTVSKIAMQLYLNTAGSDKVGFSTSQEGGRARLVGGMRGVMERNTMRYYLAIDAYLNSLAAPPAQQVERRLNEWFSMSEKYRRQLHEMDRDEYLAMKRAETRRMAGGAG
ncbi:MAG TPA: hypothetical protein VFE23_20605 [Usitatibacter sp.]|jgi:hypothetical protein|nr:hypothetical protein [Usitatibacter sp.]